MNEEIFFNLIRQGKTQEVYIALTKYPFLLKSKDSRGSTPIIFASYNNQLEIVKYLLEKGSDINEKDSSKSTSLMGVSFKGFFPIVKFLVKKKS